MSTINKNQSRISVLGICTEKSMKAYVLWTLKLMGDVQNIFDHIQFVDLTIDQKAM